MDTGMMVWLLAGEPGGQPSRTAASEQARTGYIVHAMVACVISMLLIAAVHALR